MKNLFTAFVCIIGSACAMHAQDTSPQILKEPAGWTAERFSLPPSFAPDFPFKGVEELRFSPGMFNKDSASYFSYIFVAGLDNRTSVSQSDVSDYLSRYFKGLCSVTAKDRNLVVDTSKINVAVERKSGTPGNEIIYDAVLNIFGVFADGAPVKLNMEVKVLTSSRENKIYLLFIASPRKKTDNIWHELYAIQKQFAVPG